MKKYKLFLLSIIFVLAIFIPYTRNYKLNGCLNSTNEIYIIAYCLNNLNEEDNKMLIKLKIAELKSTEIMNIYINFLNIELQERQSYLEKCYSNNGCLLSYISIYENGRFGIKPDYNKANTAYIKYIQQIQMSNDSNKKFIYANRLVSYSLFLKKSHYPSCHTWKVYYADYNLISGNINSNMMRKIKEIYENICVKNTNFLF